MRIIKIKTRNKKYEIHLESGEILQTYEDLIIKYNILYHKEIDIQTISRIEKENHFYEAYNACLSYINKRLRSKQEIKKYLQKYELPDNEETKILEKLTNLNLINDESFAKAYINDKITFSQIGPNKIKKELEEHKISEDIIDRVLGSIEEKIYKEKINKIIEKKIKTNKKYANHILKQKIVIDLINQGFQKESILEELSKYNLKSDILGIYEKYYKKYSKKYEGYDLENHLYQKLYSLGYTKEEINEIKNYVS